MNINSWNIEFPQDHLRAFVYGSEIAFVTEDSQIKARIVVWENQVNVLHCAYKVSINNESRVISIA